MGGRSSQGWKIGAMTVCTSGMLLFLTVALSSPLAIVGFNGMPAYSWISSATATRFAGRTMQRRNGIMGSMGARRSKPGLTGLSPINLRATMQERSSSSSGDGGQKQSIDSTTDLSHGASDDGVLFESKTVTFRGAGRLLELERGCGVESEPITLCGKKWQVILYPNGQGKGSGTFGQRFEGVNRAMRPTHASFGRTGVYLRYLPEDKDDYVDCVFTLALKGQQTAGPRFDVAFDCGMRFAGARHTDTSDGIATDWGAHVAPSAALGDFTRDREGGGEVCVAVNVTVFGSGQMGQGSEGQSVDEKIGTSILKIITPGMDDLARRKLGVFWRLPKDVRGDLRVGQVFVPTTLNGGEMYEQLGFLGARDRMFAVGAYPGVEYRLMGMRERATGKYLFSAPRKGDATRVEGDATRVKGDLDVRGDGVDLVVRPIYPLDKRLEREWPVTIGLEDVPCFLTQAMYNSLTLIGTTTWSLGVIAFILLAREAVSFYKIPTASMEPTIMRGNLILAEKVTPKFRGPQRGEIILFNPPDSLRSVVAQQGGTLGDRDLFVKRVAAIPGDTVEVDAAGNVKVNGAMLPEREGGTCVQPNGGAGKLVRVQKGKVKEGASFVLGDCSPVSVDSRVWGALGDEEFKARALFKLWPPPFEFPK